MASKGDEQLFDIETTRQELEQTLQRGRQLVDQARRRLERLSKGTTSH